jgi:hypothetical protein
MCDASLPSLAETKYVIDVYKVGIMDLMAQGITLLTYIRKPWVHV